MRSGRMVGGRPRRSAGCGGQQCGNAQREEDSSHKVVSLFVPASTGGVKPERGRAYPRTAPEVLSLSRDEGAGEGRGEGGPIGWNIAPASTQTCLLSPALSSISWKRGSSIAVHHRWAFSLLGGS